MTVQLRCDTARSTISPMAVLIVILFVVPGVVSAQFVDVTSGPLGDTGHSVGVAWGDYDNDGDLDLYLANRNSANKLLRNDGGGTFADATTGPLGDSGVGQGAAWGDYDNDGDLDLYLANISGANKLFRNEVAAGGHWLQVKLQGTVSNRTGIGARVRVVAGGVSRIRDISGGSGYCSQDAMVASFGLGSATVVDSLIVSWPNGILQVVEPTPAADQAVLVIEDDVTGVEDPGGDRLPTAWRLHAAVPNPFNPSTTIRFDLPQAGPVRLTIYDAAGRRVRTLIRESRQAGRHEVIWRGVDEGGRQVASGVYLYELKAGSYVETRSMTLLK